MAMREEAGWHAVHAATFGHDRWDDLSIALQRDPEHLCFLNPFLPSAELEVLKTDYGLEQTCIPGAFHFQLPDEADAQFRVVDSTDESVLFVEKVRAARHEVEIRGCDPSEALSPFIFAEGAFLIVALALRVEEGDRILDGGASPGAALVLAGALFARRCARGEPVPPDMQGFLVCNAASKQKSSHVQKMMSSLVPPNLVDHNAYGGTGGPRLVFMTADMGTPSNSVERNGPYDKILLSAPCTDDRRLARGANGGLTKWSSNGAKAQQKQQQQQQS
ncbi:unnamed protein product [Polarella glacialis]|uniref:Uncharacterized protein n=1 Tax=Polarella glacialis TaxID=89957 RepID=A0A813II46_POLGL|nr:unnamed protein product [Polarella glacialis]